ncbi:MULTISPECIES: hypothetical protein [unclassified Plantibacter]|jgi:hypothetical protein|uniref:hypothetical protein n=1 Tax=unclassified Plantibacter TaxID=2624265 RepID=UPI003D34F3B4
MSRLEPELERAVAALAKRRAKELGNGKPSEIDQAVARLIVLRDLRDAVVKEELPRATRDARALRIQFKALQAALGHASPTTIQMWAKMADELPE